MSRPKVTRTAGPLTAQQDSLDFRDWIYQPALLPLRPKLLPHKSWVTILNQGEEGACTGFGLAAMINYLLRARGAPKSERVSPRMLYEMAKRHDQWPGEDYEGSSARGAMKGWHKNGVCLDSLWPYSLSDPGHLTSEAQESALDYPLGAYYRVMGKRSDLHAALSETSVLFATAATHQGWDAPRRGVIEFDPAWKEQGGHAFAIVGYTKDGFVIQNSWGTAWGGITLEGTRYPGCALWTYPDFDRNLWDVWVARMALPVESIEALVLASRRRTEDVRDGAPQPKAPARPLIRRHFIHIDDGQFDPHGDYYSTPEEVRDLLREAVEGEARDVLIYAHGGLNDVKSAATRVAKWRPVFRRHRIHEIHLLWETGIWEELRDILLGKEQFVRARAGGFSEWWDRWFERVTHRLGHSLWKEMQSDAELAFAPDRAGEEVLRQLEDALASRSRNVRLHLVGHSAGSILLGHLLHRWDKVSNRPFENLILMAPACTHDFYRRRIRPAAQAGLVKSLHHFLLDDEGERADTVAQIYRKSLLYLVSRSYEEKGRVVPIMGLARDLGRLPKQPKIHHYTPGTAGDRTGCTSHGGFDNDRKTMNAMLELVLGKTTRRAFTVKELTGY